MRYHLQSKETGKWIASVKDVNGYDWTPIWTDTRDKAKLFGRFEINCLVDLGKVDLKSLQAFRGEWADKKAPDGVLSFARRLVRENGVVWFAGDKYRHDKLIPLKGQHIFVEADGYWIVNPHAFKTKGGYADGPENHICDLVSCSEKHAEPK